MTDKPNVTIAGGGLAGLTAALRLAQRGYAVRILERRPVLGGNLGSRPSPGDVELDVYPHMYLPWYHNFWRLLEDVGADRSERFGEFEAIRQLRAGQYPKFTALKDLYSPWYVLLNLFSGVGPVADMFVFGYASVDILAEKCQPTMLPDDVSVGGFLNARPYMTERAAAAYDHFITMVWAIPSYLASAADYREYLDYSMAAPRPAFLLPQGPASKMVIEPLVERLRALKVEIETDVEVTKVACGDGRVKTIDVRRAGGDKTEKVDELVLAVPPSALSTLIRTGGAGGRIVEAAPQLSDVARLRAQEIPILHVYFKGTRNAIPAEPVGLYGAKYALAFTDISKTWRDIPAFTGKTVLALSASDPFGLPGTSKEADGHAMLVELARFLKFDPGEAWGKSPDIDWKLTCFDANTDATLFVNETGSDDCRPHAVVDGLRNLTLAGDFCANRIGMTTIESAVTTGLEAAAAIVERRGLGTPVEISEPKTLPAPLYTYLRAAWAPYAAAAKWWSAGSDLCAGGRAAWRDLRKQLTPGP